MTRTHQSGFTLLEAMVAIIVISSVSFAAFSWVNQSIRILLRADSVLTQELLVADFLSELEVTDLTKTSDGVLVRDGVRLEWQSEVVTIRRGRTNAGGISFYDHALNEVAVYVFRDELQIDDFRVLLVSPELVRQPIQEFGQ